MSICICCRVKEKKLDSEVLESFLYTLNRARD